MSGSSNKTTSVTNTATGPWAPSQPVLKSALEGAQYHADQGNIFKPYQGSTVVPYSTATETGKQGILDNAKYYTPIMRDSFEQMAGLAGGTGFNAPQQSAMDQLQRVSQGDYLDPNTNPGFANILQQAQDSSRDAVNMGAAGMGRTGSGVHQGVLAKNVGDVTGNLLYQNYNTERGYQNQATGDLFNAGQQGYANKMGALSALPAAFQGSMAPAQAMMGVGAMDEDLAAREMNDKLRIWQGNRDAPMETINWLSAIGGGSGSMGGSSQATAQAPKPSPFMSALGGASAGFGVGGPVGGLIGGGAGLLGSLF